MIKARLDNGVFVLGLTSRNVELLKEGRPILVELSALGGADRVMIILGADEEDCMRQIIRGVDESMSNEDVENSAAQAITLRNQLRAKKQH